MSTGKKQLFHRQEADPHNDSLGLLVQDIVHFAQHSAPTAALAGPKLMKLFDGFQQLSPDQRDQLPAAVNQAAFQMMMSASPLGPDRARARAASPTTVARSPDAARRPAAAAQPRPEPDAPRGKRPLRGNDAFVAAIERDDWASVDWLFGSAFFATTTAFGRQLHFHDHIAELPGRRHLTSVNLFDALLERDQLLSTTPNRRHVPEVSACRDVMRAWEACARPTRRQPLRHRREALIKILAWLHCACLHLPPILGPLLLDPALPGENDLRECSPQLVRLACDSELWLAQEREAGRAPKISELVGREQLLVARFERAHRTRAPPGAATATERAAAVAQAAAAFAPDADAAATSLHDAMLVHRILQAASTVVRIRASVYDDRSDFAFHLGPRIAPTVLEEGSRNALLVLIWLRGQPTSVLPASSPRHADADADSVGSDEPADEARDEPPLPTGDAAPHARSPPCASGPEDAVRQRPLRLPAALQSTSGCGHTGQPCALCATRHREIRAELSGWLSSIEQVL